MRVNYKKIGILSVLFILSLCALTGCKASKKKVLSSTYYKELKSEKEELEKENEKLKEEAETTKGITADEQRAIDYLDKIARDRLVKLEIGYADNMENSEFIEDEAAFSLATAIARRADLTGKYTPEQIEEKYGPGYEYILYDEDNAVYEIKVYNGNYVIFTDLPNNVYYAYNASALGDGFLNYRDGYPNSNLLHRLADCSVITDKEGNYYEGDTANAVANHINHMDKTKSSRDKAEEAWKKNVKSKKKAQEGSYEPVSVVYTFYHHGNKMILTIYETFYSIENMDGKKTWYKAEKDDVNELKQIFTEAQEVNRQEEEAAGTTEPATTEETESEPSHSKEIQAESMMETEDNIEE